MDHRLDDISPYLLRPTRSIEEVLMERKRSVLAVVASRPAGRAPSPAPNDQASPPPRP